MSSNDDQNAVALVHRWRAAIDTQMHFNDMLIRTRTAGMSIVVAAEPPSCFSTCAANSG